MTAINGMSYYQNEFSSGRLGKTTGIIFAICEYGPFWCALFLI